MTTITFKVLGLTFHAEVKATTFIPSNTTGLSENCYPDEGVEIEEFVRLEVETKQTIEGQDVIVLVDCLWLLTQLFGNK